MSDKLDFIHSKYEIDPATGEIIGEKKLTWIDWMEKDEFENFPENDAKNNMDDNKKTNVFKDGKKFLKENFVIVISVAVLISVLVVCVLVMFLYVLFFKCCDLKGLCCTNCCNKKPDESIFDLDRVLINSGLKLETNLPTKSESDFTLMSKSVNIEKAQPSTPESVYVESECVFDRISARWTALERAGLIFSPIHQEKTVSLPTMNLKYENEDFRYYVRKGREIRPPLHSRIVARPRSFLEPIYENTYENAHMTETELPLQERNSKMSTEQQIKSLFRETAL